MYTKQDYHFLSEIEKNNIEIYNFINQLNIKQQQDLRIGCHDICNTISLIFGNFQLIELSHPELKGNHHWQQLNDDVHYLVHTMEQINLYRYARDIRPVNTKATDFINNLNKILCDELYSSLNFQLTIDQILPDTIMDIDKINYVIKSILNNIIDNKTATTVTIKIKTDGDSVSISIADKTSYIAPELRQNIFQPFVTSKQNHVGLSLATSYQIMLAHNGTLEYCPDDEIGGSFILNFNPLN